MLLNGYVKMGDHILGQIDFFLVPWTVDQILVEMDLFLVQNRVIEEEVDLLANMVVNKDELNLL